jgi:hypothetical protein
MQALQKVTKSAGSLLTQFRKEKRLAMQTNGGIVKRKIKQLKIRYSQNIIFIVQEYLVNIGLGNFVILMMQKDHDDIEFGLGL